ncbi:unnamed protein product [Gordionus sp. m RMFG-2023]
MLPQLQNLRSNLIAKLLLICVIICPSHFVDPEIKLIFNMENCTIPVGIHMKLEPGQVWQLRDHCMECNCIDIWGTLTLHCWGCAVDSYNNDPYPDCCIKEADDITDRPNENNNEYIP